MTQHTQSVSFSQSYEQCYTYPQNLVYKTSYRGVLKAYESQLETAEPPFLTHDEKDVKIYFRDWDDSKQRFLNSEVASEDTLRYYFGEVSHVDPNSGTTIWSSKPLKDPMCRFILLHGESSTKPLKITPRILKRLFTYHQVMPAMIDFLSVFAQPPQKREIGFSGFFDQVTLPQKGATTIQATGAAQQVTANSKQQLTTRSSTATGHIVSAMGRSGQQYQMCYNLKRVTRFTGNAKSAIDAQNWSIQQNEFHHQFDLGEGRALWISAKGRIKDYADEVLGLTGGANGVPEDLFLDNREKRFASSLTVHLMNCHWASQDWRGYVRYLEDAIEQKTRHILIDEWVSDEFSPESLKDVQHFEEKAFNATMVLDANIEVMTSLRDFYESLLDKHEFDIRDHCTGPVRTFVQQINDMMHTFSGYKRRMKLLADVTENRKTLLLQKLQSHATKKMEDLTTMSYRETIVMKVITVGTFVYLPATFVSTFFSTDIVKYQGSPDGKAMYSGLALERWLEVTVPLTVLTVIMGLVAFVIADRRRKRYLPSSYDEKRSA